MDVSADQYESDDTHRSGSFLAVTQQIRDIVKWLVGFFTVTEEDRLKAGIVLGTEGHD